VPSDFGPGTLVEQRRLKVAPGFADAAGGDFHLAPGSPLVDAGTPGTPPATDRDGRERGSDGDGDCTHVSDIGAFELQGSRVRAVATAGAASAAAGRPVAFSAAGSCIPGPGAPALRWSFDDGSAATGAAVGHAFATPGRHTATLTVSDGRGRSATATAAVTVTAVPARPPVISGLRIRPRRIVLGNVLPRLVRRAAKRPVATIRFTLSEAATVRMRFTRLPGHGRARTLRIKGRAGVNRVRFAGRVSRRVRLAPGRYRLTMVATDAAGARSAPARVRFAAIRR
jgi:PKD domain